MMIHPEAFAAVDAIRRGRSASDEEFDRLFPPHIQRASGRFWTPVDVALAAVQLLVTSRSSRILDIGAGVGKLCIVGGLSTGASFMGIERRRALVEIGRDAAERVRLKTATLIHGELDAVDWQEYDAIYLFNPFEENLREPVEWLDQSVPLSEARFRCDVAVVEEGLRAAPLGTRVVTYYGFGGHFPEGYRLEHVVAAGTDRLHLWVKVG
jgi:SAM-dependent methyltransferase